MAIYKRHCGAVIAIVLLTLAGAPTAHAEPEVVTQEHLGANQVDSWLVQCGAGTTRMVAIEICDTGTFDNVQFMAQAIGRTPTSASAKVVLLSAPTGGCAASRFVRGATSGAMSLVVTVTERNNAGEENYSLRVRCEDKNRLAVGNVTLTKKQDQD